MISQIGNKTVSIIITTKNSASTLEQCLFSSQNQTYPDLEIIVVDNNSTDKTIELAKKYTKNIFNHGPERSAQRNLGIKKSKGEYVLIIDSDMILSPNIVTECFQKIRANNDIIALVIPEESFGRGFWSQCKKLERSFYQGVDWMEAARFFKKDIIIELGCYDLENTGTEDYDLPQKVKNKFGNNSIANIKSKILHDEGRLKLLKTLKKKFYYAQSIPQYKQKAENINNFKKQANPIQRYKLFFSAPKKLFRNPFIGLGMLFMKTSEFIAGGLGYLYKKNK